MLLDQINFVEHEIFAQNEEGASKTRLRTNLCMIANGRNVPSDALSMIRYNISGQ